jgi:hypothetical protein
VTGVLKALVVMAFHLVLQRSGHLDGFSDKPSHHWKVKQEKEGTVEHRHSR